MNGLVFEERAPIAASAPERADIACFVGFIRRREQAAKPTPTEVPIEMRRWLNEQGWASLREAHGDLDWLLDVPVPIESWATFDRLFAWEARRAGARMGSTYLGAAVRSFFSQGGRKCYVVRVGDPWSLASRRPQRLAELAKLLGGDPKHLLEASPADRMSWSGVSTLFGLPDVSFLCMPDIADAVAVDEEPLDVNVPRPEGEERFVECSAPAAAAPDEPLLAVAPRRCDNDGYASWALVLRRAVELLQSRYLREVQLVAAVPIPHRDAVAFGEGRSWAAEGTLYRFLRAGGFLEGIESAFVQLAYPWVKTRGSTALPEGLEGPDGMLVGILARNALLRGTFSSAANLVLSGVDSVSPIVGRAELGAGLLDRVSLVGPTPGGLRLLSDVTTSPNERYRPAGVNRLISVIRRAARIAGEDFVFEPSQEDLWARLRARIERLLVQLWEAGALRGDTRPEAFSVRCDRTTMTQSDIDAGRLVVEIEIQPLSLIERIRVALAMTDGGRVALELEERS